MSDGRAQTPEDVRRFDDTLFVPKPSTSYLMTEQGWKTVRRPTDVELRFMSEPPSAAAKPLVDAARQAQADEMTAAIESGRRIREARAEEYRRHRLGALGRWLEDHFAKAS